MFLDYILFCKATTHNFLGGLSRFRACVLSILKYYCEDLICLFDVHDHFSTPIVTPTKMVSVKMELV